VHALYRESRARTRDADDADRGPVVALEFWDRLSPAEQKMMTDAANESRAYQREVSRAAAQRAVGELQAKGMQYNELSAAERARMSQIARSVTDQAAANYDPALVKLYNDELERIRK
jgi:TRAP-type transport system periplasmic protein